MPSRPAPPKKRPSRDDALSSLQRPLSELCCVNPDCADQGRYGLGNVVLRRGKGTGRWRMLRCRTCRHEFSERKGTALWHSRMPPNKAIDIAQHLAEGCGIRKTARLVGASKDGVTNLALRLGLHARALHDARVRDVKVNEAQFDEKWAFVGKKQKHCDPADPADAARGDQWDHTAIDVESRFVVSLEVGKRDRETVQATVEDFAERTGGSPPALITSDDCNIYPEVLLEQYGETVTPPKTGGPGRPRKSFKRWPKGSAYATVNKTYGRGQVVSTERKLVHGTAADLDCALQRSRQSQHINTAFVERQNGTDRNYNARKVRDTCEFSKDLVLHAAVGWWVLFCYNFHHLHRGLRLALPDGVFVHRTPAVALGLAARPWTIAEILTASVVGFTPLPSSLHAALGLRHAAGPAP